MAETGFKIYRKTGVGGSWGLIGTVNQNVTSYNDLTAQPNTTYYYRIEAYNDYGANSVDSSAITTPAGGAETSFRVERKTGIGGAWVELPSPPGANVTTYSDTSVSPNTTYYYRVRARNAAGDSLYSDEQSLTTPSSTTAGLSINLAGVTWAALVMRCAIGESKASGNHPYDSGSNKGYFVTNYQTYTRPSPTSGRIDYIIAVKNQDNGLLYLSDGRILAPSGQPIRDGGLLQDRIVQSGNVDIGAIEDVNVSSASSFFRNAMSKMQSYMSGGGNVSWSSTNTLTWSERFLVIPTALSSNGFFEFAPNTVTIPANGALYYRTQIGGSSNSANLGGAISHTAAANGWFSVPYTSLSNVTTPSGYTDWLVAVHNGDNGTLYLFDGRELRPNQTVASGQFIPNGSIVAPFMAANSILAGAIGADAVVAGNVSANVITGREIASKAVDTTKLTAEVGKIGMIFSDQVVSNDFQRHEVNVPHTEQSIWCLKLGSATTGDGGLQKTAVTNAWDSGACSTRGIYRGNGHIEWTCTRDNPTSGAHSYRMVGLNWVKDTYSHVGMNAAWYMIEDSLGPRLEIYEAGGVVGSFGSFSDTTVLKIAIEGTNIVYYKDGIVQRTRSAVGSTTTGIQYPMRVDVSLYSPNSTVPPIFLYGVITDATRTAPLANLRNSLPNNVIRSSDGNTITFLTSGQSMVRFTELTYSDGYVEFQAPVGPASSQGWRAGLTPGSSDTDLSFAVHHSVDGLLYTYEPGFGYISSGYTYSTGGADVYRIGIENGVVQYRRDGQEPPFRTSPASVNQYPYRVGVINSNANGIAPGNFYFTTLSSEGQGWKLHPRQGTSLTGVGEFNEGLVIRQTPLTEAVVRAVGSINKDGLIRGRDRAVVSSNEWIGFSEARRMYDHTSDVFYNLFFNTDVNMGASANADSTNWMRLRIFNKFGEEIKYMYFPWHRRGVCAWGFHTRNFADPVEEAVYCFEPHNAYGYSRRFYWTMAAWVYNLNPSFANRGQAPPATWIQRSQCPSNLVATTASDTSVTLSWTPPSSGTYQDVYYRRVGSSDWIRITTNNVAMSTTTYTVTGLSPNTLYDFMVHGSSTYSWSESKHARTFPAPLATPTVTAPSGLSASAQSQSQINIAWTNGTSASVEIYRSTDNVNFSIVTTVAAGVTSYSDTGLSASTPYYYRARHNNGTTTSGYSNTANATTQATPPPAQAPHSCTASSTGYYSCSVSFINPGDAARVEYGTDGSNFPNVTGYGVSSPTTISGLAEGTTYYFRVRNSSGVSNVANATTDMYIRPDPDPYCVAPNTPILVFVGEHMTWKLAKDVTAHDILITITPDGEAVFSRLKRTVIGSTSRLYSILTESGKLLQCSPSHPIITGFGDSRGTHAYRIRSGDKVLTYDTDKVKVENVVSVDYVEFEASVITFEMIDESHTFVSGGIVSHNIMSKV